MTKLEKFLRENNAWEAFKENYDPKYWMNTYASFSYFIQRKIWRAINDAFLWRNTPQGAEYWQNICDKWREYLTKGEEMNNEKEFEFKVGDRVMIEGVLVEGESENYPLDLIVGDKRILTVTVDGRRYVNAEPILKLIERPKPKLTFQFIRENLVPMKHLLVTDFGEKMLYLGFARSGHLVTDVPPKMSLYQTLTFSENNVENWTYEDYNE